MTPPEQPDLFDVGARREPARLPAVTRPYRTENKAKLIERYLFSFLMVTKHGTYIDGFAGPQEEELESENWSSRLVLQLRPQWLKKFVLIEKNPEQVERIFLMLKQRPRTPLRQRQRNVRVIEGDVNHALPRYLADYSVKANEATFCLLDQRTFECEWATVETVATHKRRGNKIEIFYFLANAWLNRSAANMKDTAKLHAWWGRSDWGEILKKSGWDRALVLESRFRDELGYRYANAHPIYNRIGGRKIMYFMIHATDHPAAALLMRRAYNRAVEPLPTQRQIDLLVKKLAAE